MTDVWRSGHDYPTPDQRGNLKLLYVIWGRLPSFRLGSYSDDHGGWTLEHERNETDDDDDDDGTIILPDAWVVAWSDLPTMPAWAIDYVFKGSRAERDRCTHNAHSPGNG